MSVFLGGGGGGGVGLGWDFFRAFFVMYFNTRLFQILNEESFTTWSAYMLGIP